MKCLTVCEPFASALIYGGKPIENRKRPLGHVGPLLIHAGKSLAWFEPETVAWLHERWPDCPSNPIAAMHKFKANMGKVIGMVWAGRGCWFNAGHMPGWWTDRHAEWGTGPYCIPCMGPTRVAPFDVRGQQGVFVVPALQLTDSVIQAADDLMQLATERGWE